MMLVLVNTSALPAENLMLSRFAPADHQGLAFGVKFVLAFISAPLAIWLIKIARELTGDFSGLLIGLSLSVALVIPLILFLPNERSEHRLAEPA
jgi:MFS transporter, FSR family, fosmidomycin resistance protein